MTRTCGWNPRGKRLIAHVPHGHWKTLTFLAGLRHDRIVAPFVLDGAINGPRHCHLDQWRSNGSTFTAWVEQCLAPTLAPGDVLASGKRSPGPFSGPPHADNLGSHKGRPARQLIRNKGAHLLFLPPYSPDLNPIDLRRENDPPDHFLILLIFAKLKTLFRKADERTIEAAWRKVGTLLDAFSPTECQNYLRHAGYASI